MPKNIIQKPSESSVEVGDLISHPVFGPGTLIAGWGDFLKIQFIDEIKQVYDRDGLFIVRNNADHSWALLNLTDAKNHNELQSSEYNFELAMVTEILTNDYINADKILKDLKCISSDDFDEIKIGFIRNWINDNIHIVPGKTSSIPDKEQLKAISSVNGNIQVIARAGSGKTSTLVYRTYFLIKHCRVDPATMLILAFNRKAALEIRRRLLGLTDIGADAAIAAEINRRIRAFNKGKRIDKGEIEASAIDTVAQNCNITLPHVMTFHALAYAVVHPEESILFNGAEGESQELNRIFQGIIDDHLKDTVWRGKIQELMLAHFREDWSQIVAGKYDQSKEDLLQFRRSLTLECIGGEYVKSFGEKLIANFLFEHDIAYKYERNHYWSGINYRPDFTIFKSDEKQDASGVIIEYFGMQGDVDYDKMSNDKRVYWADKVNWNLIEFCPNDITSNGVDSFLNNLKSKVEALGITCTKLTEEEIWHRVKDRAIDRFTVASGSFIGRCRKQLFSPTKLKTLIDSYSPNSPIEAKFLNIACQLYVSYLDRLSATGEDDFDGLMQRAADVINSGNTIFLRKSVNGNLALLKYLCIDEFQDFSELFYKLLDAIRKINPNFELFCVGDDWQAINGFAGSDLKYFKNFDEYIGKSQRLYISTNYRSSRSIVSIGIALMSGLGKPAVTNKQTVGKVLLSDINYFVPTTIEKERHPGDIITPAVIRIVNQALMENMDVVILCRRNALPYYVNFQEQTELNGRGLERFLNLVRSYFPKDLQERITISTAHKYKGLEKSMVIVLDAVARSYPLIHPDWIFYQILGDNAEKIIEEERRLFYVALTRAVDKLVVLTDGLNMSPFLVEMNRTTTLTTINWAGYHVPASNSNNSRFVVDVSGETFPVKDQLKSCGYKWHATNKCWEKSFSELNFNIDLLKIEPWANSSSALIVRINSETNMLISQHSIDNGVWCS